MDKLSISDFIAAYRDGVLAQDSRADVRQGSMYEILGGTAALLWTREVQRDADLFADVMTDSADGGKLSDRVLALFGTQRVLDTPGTGTVALTRSSLTAGAGTFWEGTRIALVDRNGLTDPMYVEVATDTTVGATDPTAVVPIRSILPGNGTISSSSSSTVAPRFEDTIWDTSWTFNAFTLGAGTSFEPAAQYRARARTERLNARVGYETAIINACRRAGAVHVELFPANYAGAAYDSGMNMLYVSDASYLTSSALIGACMLALEGYRILGDNLQIRPMQPVALTVEANVFMNDAPSKFNQSAVVARIQNVIASALANDFTYSRDAFRGAVFKAVDTVLDIDFVTPLVDGVILSGTNTMPATLSRYTLRPENVIVHLMGPR